MSIETINKLGYSLVSKIQSTPKLKESLDKKERTGSFEHIPCEDWSDKVLRLHPFERTENFDRSTKNIIKIVDGLCFGFNEVDFKIFAELISDIELLSFASIISRSILEEKVLDWIVDVKINNVASFDLCTFLTFEVEKIICENVYYFPLFNLHIPYPFTIGNVEFTFFKEDYFVSWWNSMKDTTAWTEDEFYQYMSKFQGRVFASYKVKAEYNKGEQIAFENVGIAVDVLKLFTPTIFYPNKKCLIELEQRININFESFFLSRPVNEIYTLSVNIVGNHDLFDISDEMYKMMSQMGMKRLSNFIKNETVNELRALIFQAIKLYSQAVSERNLHYRIVQLITIIESLFIEEDVKWKMETKIRERIGTLLFKNDTSKSLQLEAILKSMYAIRHKQIHKAKYLPIDIKLLASFQIIIMEILLKPSALNSSILYKEDLIKYLDKNYTNKATNGST